MSRLSTLSRSVADRVVLITGAASGMGRATAHLFADEGAKVAVTDLGQDGVDLVVREITEAGGTAAGWTLDVGDLDRIHTVVDEIGTTLGDIGVVVNNAGIAVGGTLGVWTLILGIQDAIFVVIWLGAAILILKLIDVFRIQRALVVRIGEAIFVVIWFGAAIFILKLIKVFRL